MNYLTFEQVKRMTGLSRTSIWRYESNECFPKRRQLGPRRVGWVESEVLEWMESRRQVDSAANEVIT